MIDVQVQTLGGQGIVETLQNASSGLRDVLRAELATAGDEMVARAQSLAPKRSGILQSRIVWFFGREMMRSRGRGRGKYRAVVDTFSASKHARKSFRSQMEGAIFFTFRPLGRVAHLVERGVNASFHQRPGRRGRDTQRRGQRVIGPYAGGDMQGPEYRYARTLRIAPRPFFQPAVESVGGAGGVNARLQGALDRFVQQTNAGAA